MTATAVTLSVPVGREDSDTGDQEEGKNEGREEIRRKNELEREREIASSRALWDESQRGFQDDFVAAVVGMHLVLRVAGTAAVGTACV